LSINNKAFLILQSIITLESPATYKRSKFLIFFLNFKSSDFDNDDDGG